jgi:predicted AlkP superfamily phosphohydrolase/phosphomutase
MTNKIIILGLDGATWTKLDEYIKNGTMTNFQSIIKEGTRATFNSNFPFTSGTAWTSIFTGVNPGKHGIPHYSIEGKQEVPSIWEVLSERGLTSLVMNDLITYPPLKIKGMMISGGFSTPSQSKNFTYPIKIREEIYEFMNEYTPSLDHNIIKKAQEGKLDEFYDNVKEFGDKILQTGLHLATKHDWDIFCTTIENPDYIHHFYWDKTIFLEKFYQWLDIQINEFYKLAKANNANLFIISDHGFGPIKKHFLINTWLEQSGFTKLGKPGAIRKTLSKTSVKRDLVRKSLSKFKIRKFASKFTPQIIKGMIPIEEEEEGFIQKETQVFSEAYNEITVKINNLDEYEKTRNKIIEELLQIEDCGQKVVKEALKRENTFNGTYVDRAHDIQLLLNEGYCWSPAIREKFLLTPEEFEKVRTGDHRPEGMLFAVGPDIKSNHCIKKEVKNFDFFPTILHLLGQNIPDYTDGEVIKEIFDENSEIRKISVIVENMFEKQFLKKRIQELRRKSRF